MAIQLLELRVGKVAARTDAQGKAWRSAIGKEAVPGPLHLGTLGLAGDEVGHPEVHGGPDQAVLAYDAAQYPLWRAEGVDVHPGAFGENLLLEGLTDAAACIGDIYGLGEARIQVSQPRQPCRTLARATDQRDIVARIWDLCRGGWYFRVLGEGLVTPGQTLTLLERPHPEATVARVLCACRRAGRDREEALALAALEGLSGGWRQAFREMAAGRG